MATNQAGPLRNCPKTGGRQVSMTKSGWEKVCAAARAEAEGEAQGWKGPTRSAGTLLFPSCLTCSGEIPSEVKIIDVTTYQQSQKKEKTMSNVNNTLGDLNTKLFAQLDRLADEKISGEALASEINRAKAVTDVACQIISVGSLALKAKIAFKESNPTGHLPKMLEG